MTVVTGNPQKTYMSTQEFQEDTFGISLDSLNRFGIRQDDSGNTYFPYFRHGGISAYKVRRNTTEHSNRFYAIGDMNEVELFGMHLCSSSDSLVITEGEKDAISAWEMLGKGDVVSIPTGATIKKDGTGVIDKGVKARESFLKRYKTIYLCLDQDDPGQAVATAIAKWLGKSCRIVRFSENDCNEMLKEGKTEEFSRAIAQAQPFKSPSLYTSRDLAEKLTEPPSPRIPYPWKTLNQLTGGGMKMGDVETWAAGAKVGKTKAFMQLIEWLVCQQKEKVFLGLLENDPLEMGQMVAGMLLKDIGVADGDAMTPEQVEHFVTKTQGMVWNYGGPRDWEDIKADMLWLSASEGVRFFFLDPLTAMSPGEPSEANAFLNNLYCELTELAKKHSWHVICSSHLNPPKSGLTHEEGGQVIPIQLTGSKAMLRYSQLLVGIERNTQAEDEETRNRATFRVLVGRGFRVKSGKFFVYYNDQTGSFLETPVFKAVPGGMVV